MSIPEKHRRRTAPVAVLAPPPDAGRAPFVQTFEQGSDFHVEALSSDGLHRVVLRGELDLVGAPVLWNRIREVCEGPTRGLRLDLRRLSFMDSSGLHVVLDARAMCARNGWDFEVFGSAPAVRRVFEVSGLGSLLGPQRP